jgi:hypothetical protein
MTLSLFALALLACSDKDPDAGPAGSDTGVEDNGGDDGGSDDGGSDDGGGDDGGGDDGGDDGGGDDGGGDGGGDDGGGDDGGGDDGGGDDGGGDDGGEDPVPDVDEFGFVVTRELVLIGDADDGLDVPRDIAFHPERDELWVQNRYGLDSVLDGGSHTIFFEAGVADGAVESRADTFAYHFMDEVSSMAFGDATYDGSDEITFATCQESRNDYGGFSPPNDFMGPTLWPSDLELYAEVNQSPTGSLGGSHLDMLHQSPLCVGIEHEVGNAYWVADGTAGNLVRYDFAEDHDMGYDDHSDGIVRRFPEVTFTYVADVPAHLVLDEDTSWLYLADPGGGRVVRVDITTGEDTRPLDAYGERLAEYTEWTGADVEVFAEGLSRPSGVAIGGGKLFVSDNATGELVAFDLADGSELGRMETGAASIMGIAYGPEGRIWYVDADNDEAWMVDPGTVEE